jgi:hypothetical protein
MRAKAEADTIIAADPELCAPAHRLLPALVDSVAAARALLVTS